MTVAEHLVASTRGGDRSLWEPERALWLWARLQRALPTALGAKLMPDHVHLVAPLGHAVAFRRVLTGFTVRFGVRFDVPAPQQVHSAAIALRTLRYVLFNGVRAGYVTDPFASPWSTLRDLIGATHPPWTPLTVVARVLRIAPSRLVGALTTLAEHRPIAPQRQPIAVASTEAMRAAVASALRVPFAGTPTLPRARRLIVQAHHAIGRPRAASLACELACSVRTLHRDRAPKDPALDAMLLCLGDARLRLHGCGDDSDGRVGGRGPAAPRGPGGPGGWPES